MIDRNVTQVRICHKRSGMVRIHARGILPNAEPADLFPEWCERGHAESLGPLEIGMFGRLQTAVHYEDARLAAMLFKFDARAEAWPPAL
jgi:hypothetical protein